MDGNLYHRIDADTLTLKLKEAAKVGKEKNVKWYQFKQKKKLKDSQTSADETPDSEEVGR